MTGIHRRIGITLVTCLALSSAGCGVSDLANAAAKLADGQIGALTANEIRMLSEAAVNLLNSQDPTLGLTPLTQPQAEALVAFLDANNVETQQDLDTLVANTDANPPAGLDALAAAFGYTDPNGADSEDLEQVLLQAFGG